MTTQKPFLSFIVEPELLKLLDDFQFQYRFRSRSQAIKWLLKWALENNPNPK